MEQGSGLIHYRCTAPGHQQGAVGRTADTLTVHESKWSYCPMDIRAKGHQWEPTGGVAIETLRRGSPTINLDLDVRPHVPPVKAAAPDRATARPASAASSAKKRAPKV